MHAVAVLIHADFSGKVKCIDNQGEEVEMSIEFEQILAFTTGSPCEPPLGFDPPPHLEFQSYSPFPRANTCTCALYLPLIIPQVNLEKFNYFMISGSLNSAGFGLV